MASSSTLLLTASEAVLSGVAAHVLLWVHGEWDSFIGQIILSALFAHFALLLILYFLYGQTILATIVTASCLETLHLLGTFASITVYRVFFHRLRHFPGPWRAKIWIWDIFSRTWNSGHRQSIVLDELHAKYGPVVRYAPDRLSVNFAAAVPLIHGTGSTSICTKSVVYLNPVNGGSINADRDVSSHHARRRLWERALSARMLSSYVKPFVHHTFELVEALLSKRDQTVRVNYFVRLFTFDVMGTVGFGRNGGFEGLSTGKLNTAVETLVDMMGIGVYMMLVPWLHVLADYIPAMGVVYRPDELFRGFASETLGQYHDNKGDERREHLDLDPEKSTSQIRPFQDILSQVHPDSSPDDRRAISDCVLLAIAGADTTTSSIIHILYRLAKHGELQTALHEELVAAGAPAPTTESSQEDFFARWVETAKLPFLEAFMREVLRLHPPAPTGLPRLTPPEGLVIQHGFGEPTFIPGYTNVSVPVYTLLKDPHNFAQPLEFLPQRFLPSSHPAARPELVLDGRAYVPFLQGPYGCAGKQFAYLEMKVVISSLVNSFLVTLPQTEDPKEIDQRVQSQWRDFSTVKAAQLDLRFTPRPGLVHLENDRKHHCPSFIAPQQMPPLDCIPS